MDPKQAAKLERGTRITVATPTFVYLSWFKGIAPDGRIAYAGSPNVDAHILAPVDWVELAPKMGLPRTGQQVWLKSKRGKVWRCADVIKTNLDGTFDYVPLGKTIADTQTFDPNRQEYQTNSL